MRMMRVPAGSETTHAYSRAWQFMLRGAAVIISSGRRSAAFYTAMGGPERPVPQGMIRAIGC
jgi:hypothetical protein